ncbi:hypothetical protein DPMN_031787 [Dreissena polymorpha]|uniref:Uncharacterized protein n=1 Tax=Dreissena polymorpha TaxID=45954 RepID=A0A9D4RHD8_DREPO|nr:hypothetical protein DPMN_031787 [Dreissena polymorpha]
MTEDKTFNAVRQYIAESTTSPSTAGKATTTGSPVAGPSRAIQTSDDDSMSVDEDVTDDEKCCVCKKYNSTSKDGSLLQFTHGRNVMYANTGHTLNTAHQSE